MPKARKPPADALEVPAGIRDRVVEFRRVPSEELMDNERNWRLHPYAQQAAIGELIEQIGIAGALTAYHSERNGGALTLIDGHERRGHQADWPTLILDVTDEEADLLLLTLDPLVNLAGTSAAALENLLAEARFGTPALEDVLQQLQHRAAMGDDVEDEDEDGRPKRERDPAPEMGLQPFEHYDYVVLVCRNQHDWMSLQQLLGVEQAQFTIRDGKRRRFGLGRVIDAAPLLERLRAAS